MTLPPELIVDIVRLVWLSTSRVYEDADEIERLGPIVDGIQDRYGDLRRTSFSRARLISTAEGVARLLGSDASGIVAEVDARIARQRAAQEAEDRDS